MENKKIVLQVENISKCYRIGLKETLHDNFSSLILDFIKSPLKNYRKYRSLYKFDDISKEKNQSSDSMPSDIIWALRDISFEVRQGDVVGIIGANGAGKSTLLKILSKITDPENGRIQIRGRVASLLEVGTGFHQELTGRENVYLNGTVLGMTKKEIDRKFDEIVDFSGVEKFIDTPVKRYSSGMKVRLAFSVAAHLEPEILLIDEVLAVGDVAFQKKCLGKMEDISKEGRTVLFVSHNMAAVSALCKYTIVIENGIVDFIGSTNEALERYISRLYQETKVALTERTDRRGNGMARVEDLWIETENGNRVSEIACGDSVLFKLLFRAKKEYSSFRFVISIYNDFEQRILRLDSEKNPPKNSKQWKSSGTVGCRILDPLPLSPGRYRANVTILINETEADGIINAFDFNVIGGNFYGNGKLHNAWPMFLVHNTWTIY
jgi:lipopolysaccharide transport system ATP-binding protein